MSKISERVYLTKEERYATFTEGDIVYLIKNFAEDGNEDGLVLVEEGTKGKIVKKYGNSNELEVEWEWAYTMAHKDIGEVERPDYRTEIPYNLCKLDVLCAMKVKKNERT